MSRIPKQDCKDFKYANYSYKGKILRTSIRTRYRLSDLRTKFNIFTDILFHITPITDNCSRFYLLRSSKRRSNDDKIFYHNLFSLKFVFNKDGGYEPISLPKFEPVVFKYIISQHGKVFIDVGANQGGYSIHSFRNFEKIIAVEPSLKAQEILKKNIDINSIKNITIIPKAVTTLTGKVKLFHADDLVNYSIVNQSDVYEEVPTISLNDLLLPFDSVDLVKIDVEGAELDVINSGLKYLNRVKSLVIEVRHRYEGEIVSLMKKLGFRCYVLEWRKDLDEKNLLFLKENFE
ncbi:MAG: FkbM family methyltransferase [Thermoplasmata archaeon]|jgi:FkbM family methyltransferase